MAAVALGLVVPPVGPPVRRSLRIEMLNDAAAVGVDGRLRVAPRVWIVVRVDLNALDSVVFVFVVVMTVSVLVSFACGVSFVD